MKPPSRQSNRQPDAASAKEQFMVFFEGPEKKLKDLSPRDSAALKNNFVFADANETGAVEEDDVKLLVSRILGDGVSKREAERILLLLGLDVNETWSIPFGVEFYRFGRQLVPLLKRKKEEFEAVRKSISILSLEDREAASTEWEDKRLALEIEFGREIDRLEGIAKRCKSKDASPQEQKQTTAVVAAKKKERFEARRSWAAAAVILTPAEQEKLRAQSFLERQRHFSQPVFSQREPVIIKSTGYASSGGGSSAARRPRAPPKPDPNPSVVGANYDESLRSAFLRAPFIPSLQDADPQDVGDLRSLFSVLANGKDAMGPDDVTALINKFTPVGCDEEEAVDFLLVDCGLGGPPLLSFEAFAQNLKRLKERCRAYDEFLKMGADEKRAAVAAKIANKRPLARYERIFQRGDECPLLFEKSLYDERKEKTFGTSSFLSNREYLLPHSSLEEKGGHHHSPRPLNTSNRQKQSSPRPPKAKREEKDGDDESIQWKEEKAVTLNELEGKEKSPLEAAETPPAPEQQQQQQQFSPKRTATAPTSPRRSPRVSSQCRARIDRLIGVSEYRRIQDEHFMDLLKLSYAKM